MLISRAQSIIRTSIIAEKKEKDIHSFIHSYTQDYALNYDEERMYSVGIKTMEIVSARIVRLDQFEHIHSQCLLFSLLLLIY